MNRKLEDYCYPIVRGAPGSYEQSWGFKSLLGALWVQMMLLMRADRQCWWCGKPLDPGMPRQARFCKNNGVARTGTTTTAAARAANMRAKGRVTDST
jgi:hypothetical protein